MHIIGDQYENIEVAKRVARLWKDSYIQQDLDNGTWSVITKIDPARWDFWSPKQTEEHRWVDLKLQPCVIESIEALEKIMSLICNIPGVSAWDTETTGLEWQTAELVGIGVCWGLEPDQLAYIPINHWKGNNLDLTAVINVIKPVLESPMHEKAFHNAKYDSHIFLNYGIQVRGIVADTIVADYLIKPDKPHALDVIIQEYMNVRVDKYEMIISRTKDDLKTKYKTKDRPHLNKVNISHADIDVVAQYCGMDVWSTLYLVHALDQKLADLPKIETLYYDVELPLISILLKMERVGLSIDHAWYKRMLGHLQQANSCLTALGKRKYDVNIQSPMQIRNALKELFGVVGVTLEGVETDEYSTDATTLLTLMDQTDDPGLIGFIRVVLANRKIQKMKGTYVEGILKRINPSTQRLHTQYNQTVTDTGRLSSSNPNSQNFPSRGKAVMYRAGIIPEEGYLFLGADYSACELRILAHFSQCQAFLTAFNEGRDIHAETARLIFGLSGDPTYDQRYAGKTINFGVIYGMQQHKLSRMLKCSITEAEELLHSYWIKLPEIKEFVDQSHDQAVYLGYTETILGRRRYFNFVSPQLVDLRGRSISRLTLDKNRIHPDDAKALRASANHRIQGSNADITKKAMIKWDRTLDPTHGYMSLSIHDEIISSIKEEWVDHYLPIKKHVMENVIKLSVPLKVDARIGINWRKTK